MQSGSTSLKNPYIFLLNGPAGSGKDTAGNFLAKSYNGEVKKFAEPLKRAATAIYHGGDRAAFDLLDTLENKGIEKDLYFGKTCRKVQIGISEAFLKPFHDDQRVFGKLLINDIEKDRTEFNNGPYFITDSGFRPEAEELIEKYGAGNIFLLRLHRDGHSFSGDSRGYITLKDLDVREFDVQNPNENMQVFFGALSEIVNHILHPRTI